MATDVFSLSIVAGSMVCNAKCQFCMASMTPQQGLGQTEPAIDISAFHQALRYATARGVGSALITGKGEPTLFPGQISLYLALMQQENLIPWVELQTNGLLLSQKRKVYDAHVKNWKQLGLRTISISIVHYLKEINQKVYTGDRDYIDLPELVEYLHERGFSVRFSVVLAKDLIDNVEAFENMINFANTNKVEQLTLRPVAKPNEVQDSEVGKWVGDNFLEESKVKEMAQYLASKGTLLDTLPHGANVYDVDGQNVCFTNCLTRDPNGKVLRQLIFFPDGHLRYDWEKGGALYF